MFLFGVIILDGGASKGGFRGAQGNAGSCYSRDKSIGPVNSLKR